jgi:predicted dienelactone hydrolase
MRLLGSAVSVAFCLTAAFARAAGFQVVEAPADASGPALQAGVWSPCREPPGEVKLRSTTLRATANCAVAGEKLPLVVISHGYRGSFTGHHDIAEALADAGFVVAALNHPVDSGAGDMSRADTFAAFVDRPADIKRLIDAMLGAWPDRARLDPQAIGLFGFSRGGYTGLVVAGGNPDLRKAKPFCAAAIFKPMCWQLLIGDIPAHAPIHDPRVKAAVIADPAFGPLFDRESLKDVKIPLQLWASEFSSADTTGGEVTPGYVAAVAQDLPVTPDLHIVPNAGHFAFSLPCPPERAQALPKICADRPGFDRTAFHAQFNAAVVAFFGRTLIENHAP